MPSHYAERLDAISPFRVMELMERAKTLERAGRHVVHFEVGEPDFPTAQPIIDAGHAALAAGQTKYTQALGIPELREAIADDYTRRLQLPVSPERVVVTSGASAGLLLLAGLTLDPGDELLLADPGYPCNEVFVLLTGARARRIPVTPASGFQITPEQLDAHWGERTRGLLLASPANPTGAIIGRVELETLALATQARGGWVLLDEIYQGLVYDEAADYRSGLEISDDILVLNSFSKYFGMTGWRLGWMVLPEAVVEAVTPLAQNLFISPSSIAQHAALAAFSDAAMVVHEQRRATFAERRDRLLAGLLALGFAVPVIPAGAFYLYVDVSHTGLSATDFCWRLVDEFQVAVTPGTDFGANQAESYVRFAYTTSDADIDLGLERLGTALETWQRAAS